MGSDGKLHAYSGGVWAPGEGVVAERVASLLGERLRHTHMTNTRLQLTSRGLPVITCEPVAEFINLRNGLLDWHTGKLKPHDPTVLSTVQIPWTYKPNATCPRITTWFESVLPDDCTAFVFELLGYLLLSGNPMQRAVMLMGGGSNGKGTFLRIVTAMLGRENIASVPLQALSDNRFAAADLFGKIANIAGDLDARRVDDTSVFKMVTGGDTVRAEYKYGAAFNFTCWAVPVFSANKIPASADPSEGYLRRWIVVPFPRRLTPEEKAGFTEEPLHRRDEMEGLVARAVVGLRTLMARGTFEFPASVLAAADEFASQVDHVRSYVTDRCTTAPAAWTPRASLFEDYKRWGIDERRDHLLTASAFYERLAGVGYRPATRKGTRGFAGVSVKDAP